MQITAVRALPLRGATPDGGWAQGFDPEEDLHTLVAVETDAGITGWGSVFTSGSLVEAALRLLRPYLLGEEVEPERVSEKLLQCTFWQGRGGTVAHAISGIDIAMWDAYGKQCGQPVGRLLGGRYRDRIRPYASILFAEPNVLRRRLEDVVGRGFRAVKMGWAPFGRVDSAMDRTLVRVARETVGDSIDLLVDAGGSEQYWPHGYKWALETSKMLADHGVGWFEEALPPDD
ncbi:MAG: mandelate racemase/muconate lactonizing enzyme family protein, partial [Armatimonadota bacterium]